jgi:IclR family transcriptional regulator, acetate operon repressor
MTTTMTVRKLEPRLRHAASLVQGAMGHSHGQAAVRSLVRALSILNSLAEFPNGISLTELAQQVGLSTSTTHRLLTTLEEQRYVRFEHGPRLWMIGIQSFVTGSTFIKARNFSDIARPHMRALMEETGETVNLAVPDGGEMVLVAQVECRQLMRALGSTGRRVPLHCSAVGKALLATLSEVEIARLLHKHGLPRFTATTLTTLKRLRGDLIATNERGYALDNEEHSIGVRCIGAAIVDEHREFVGALSVSGPAVRVTSARTAELGRLVRKAADAVSTAYGCADIIALRGKAQAPDFSV